MSEPSMREEIAAALKAGQAIVCYTQCWPCQFGEHYKPKKWHTWADEDDVEHAKATGQPDPRFSRCGCYCADVEAA